MRKYKGLFLAAALALAMTGCSGSSENAVTTEATTTAEVTTTAPETTEEKPAETKEPEEITGGFHVEGTKLLDAKGNEFVFRGINEAHAWYKSEDGLSLKALADAGCNSVRIVCGSGQKNAADTKIVLDTLIRVAKNLQMIVILEAHDATGDNSIESLEQVADYWISVKDSLIGNEAYVILNIANEWYGNWNGMETWVEGYTTVIPKLREAGIKNTLMVDAAGWGQYAKSIKDYGKEVFAADSEANTMFSIHMYGAAGKNEKTIREGIEGVTSQDLCVCVGEFGYKHSDGDVDEAYIMDYCTDNEIGYLGWSWKGNSGGVEYLDIAEEWDGSVLSEDWGEVLINGENGIRATSKLCSVFE